MSVALETSKRKFYKLLDNISSSSINDINSSTSLDQSKSADRPTTPAPPAKRSRFFDGANSRLSTSRPSSRGTPRPSSSTGSAMQQARPTSIHVVGDGSNPITISSRPTVNYAPWSREQFLARLETFSDVKSWTPKPDCLSEVEWAKRGWSCDGWNRVACRGGCEQRVVLKLKSKMKDDDGDDIPETEDPEEEIEPELIDRYKNIIVSGHTVDCLWHKAGCKDSIYHIPIANPDKCHPELLRRYQSLLSIRQHLPPLQSLIVPEYSPETLAKVLPPSLIHKLNDTILDPKQQTTDITDQPHLVCLAFSLFGWSGVDLKGVFVARCEDCFQRIGLWLYTPERIKEMSARIECEEGYLRLNLIEAHREHCPWKNPISQANPPGGTLSGLGAAMALRRTLLIDPPAKESLALGPEDDLSHEYTDSEKAASMHLEKDQLSRWKKLKGFLHRRSTISGKSPQRKEGSRSGTPETDPKKNLHAREIQK